MNRWDILPCDAQNHIFYIVAAQTIQENWREHDRRTTYTINLLKKYTEITKTYKVGLLFRITSLLALKTRSGDDSRDLGLLLITDFFLEADLGIVCFFSFS